MYNILILEGDGIGKEIMKEAVKMLHYIEKINNKKIFNLEYADIGGIAIDNHGTPLPETTLSLAKNADAILLGAVGGYKWDHLEMEHRPEFGLLRIRKELGLFANIRPVKIISELINISPLKAELISNLDIVIIRELTGGLYFGKNERGYINDEEYAYNTMQYTSSEIYRIGEIAFEIAQKRSQKICSVDKANVLVVMKLWRNIMNKISVKYSNIKLSHQYVDAMAMELVKNPQKYDVIVCENMFGDILSDLASQLVGSIGILPSASLGNLNSATSKRFALYEPIHGSAPDIAGQNIANPIGMIMCVKMMLEYSFEMHENAIIIENLVNKSIQINRTKDIFQNGKNLTGTNELMIY